MPLLASFPPTVELAKLIASNVDDGKTLRNLSVVDKGFYLATRPSIWSELCAPFRKRTHRTDPLEPFRRIQTALDSDVEKAKSVKVCRLPITVNNQSILLNILSRLPNLEVLIIAQRLPPYTWADFDAHHSVLREFYESCDELPVLNHIHRLDLQVTHEWHRELLKLLPKTPNLRSLYVEDRRQDVITNVNLPTWTVQLSHLDDLHISVDRHSFHVLARLCAKAPHLQHLEITWKRFSGQVPDRHAIQIFQSCQCLTSLFNDFASDIQCFDRGLWETIFVDGVVEKFSKLRTVAMLLPEPVKDCDVWIPSLPKMDLLLLFKPKAVETEWEVADFLESISRDVQLVLPALTHIYFSSWMQTSNSRDIKDFENLSPSSWCSSDIQSALIRTYTNGKYWLIHFRANKTSPSVYHGEGHEQADGKCLAHNDWLDLAIFNPGHRITDEVLSRVYSILGETKEWENPGRDLELPEEAWAVLRASRASVEGEDSECDFPKKAAWKNTGLIFRKKAVRKDSYHDYI